MAPEKLSREAVVERALKLGDEEGLEAVTIRRLAHDLGVTPMALYWHFKNKELLLQGIADHALTPITLTSSPPDTPWDERLRGLVASLIDVLREHPCLVELLPSVRMQHLDAFLRATEIVLELLGGAGFPVDRGFLIASQLLHGSLALVGGEQRSPDPVTGPEAVEFRRQKRLSMEKLPADRFPCLVSYARTLDTETDADDYYAFGLDLMIAGVVAMAPRAG